MAKMADNKRKKLEAKERKKWREIINHLDVLILGLHTATIDEALAKVRGSPKWQKEVANLFGVTAVEIEQYIKQNRKSIPEAYFSYRSLTKEEWLVIVKHLQALHETADALEHMLDSTDHSARHAKWRGCLPKGNEDINKLNAIIKYIRYNAPWRAFEIKYLT